MEHRHLLLEHAQRLLRSLREAREVVRVAVRAARLAPDGRAEAARRVWCSQPEQSLAACLASASSDTSSLPALRACTACRSSSRSSRITAISCFTCSSDSVDSLAKVSASEFCSPPKMSGPAFESGETITSRRRPACACTRAARSPRVRASSARLGGRISRTRARTTRASSARRVLTCRLDRGARAWLVVRDGGRSMTRRSPCQSGSRRAASRRAPRSRRAAVNGRREVLFF